MTELIGCIAATLTTISFLPQVIHTIKTRDTAGISFLMYALFVAGVSMWLTYGILLQNKIVIIANAITLVLSAIVLFVKIKNHFR